ncbi:MAG: NADPH-dependent assimilatory sulfite reductase hemoprotein subunit [Deltaproteobacteria bacterium]|nr:NADPH-dependent assimilatory sulfite reductase hemoprotein subunit [Deltaproteobacteria bacterium]MBW2413111.1 NADPH-dependent assimilatory sulfite reductase hemoprotein subunit [Deltaproteobacteria bacterium]
MTTGTSPKPAKPAVSLSSADVSKMSKNERLKANSDGLFWVAGRERHSFGDELDAMTRGETDTIGGDAKELSKFFGIYKQQERVEGRKVGAHSFMLRLRVPGGGEFSPAQWKAVDEASDRFADGTLRITTRQGVQFHRVPGRELGALVRWLNREYENTGYVMSSLGACGDVNRNTMCSPVDDLVADRPLRTIDLAHEIASELAPVAGGAAYHQIFIENQESKRLEPVTTDEPLYGKHYLPRKFKVGFAHPGDNSADILTQDVGFMPIVNGGAVGDEYDLYSGGGLGVTHNNEQTAAHLGLYLGRVPREQVVAVTRALAELQRDNGERKDRRQARWKYTIRRLGIETVQRELREGFGIQLKDAKPVPLPPNRFFLGWHREAGEEERYWLGVPVLSGRLRDDGPRRQRSAVREAVAALGAGVRLTPNQDLLICHVPAAERARVEAIFADHGVPLDALPQVARRQALACPAKPTCGLAMTDAELSLPRYLDEIEAAGCGDVDVVIRISGCPNSCSRPPSAEIGIVGYGKNDHVIQVGGSREGTRLGRVLYPRVPEADVSRVLIGLLRAVRDENPAGLPAGEYLHETPLDELRVRVGYQGAQ